MENEDWKVAASYVIDNDSRRFSHTLSSTSLQNDSDSNHNNVSDRRAMSRRHDSGLDPLEKHEAESRLTTTANRSSIASATGVARIEHHHYDDHGNDHDDIGHGDGLLYSMSDGFEDEESRQNHYTKGGGGEEGEGTTTTTTTTNKHDENVGAYAVEGRAAGARPVWALGRRDRRSSRTMSFSRTRQHVRSMMGGSMRSTDDGFNEDDHEAEEEEVVMMSPAQILTAQVDTIPQGHNVELEVAAPMARLRNDEEGMGIESNAAVDAVSLNDLLPLRVGIVDDDERKRRRLQCRFVILTIALLCVVLGVGLGVAIPLALSSSGGSPSLQRQQTTNQPTVSVAPSNAPTFSPTQAQWLPLDVVADGTSRGLWAGDTTNEFFGSTMVWKGNTIAIGAPGYNQSTGLVRIVRFVSDTTTNNNNSNGVDNFMVRPGSTTASPSISVVTTNNDATATTIKGNLLSDRLGSLMDVSSDGHTLVYRKGDNTLVVYQLRNSTSAMNSQQWELATQITLAQGISTIAVSGNGRVVAASLGNNTVVSWDLIYNDNNKNNLNHTATAIVVEQDVVWVARGLIEDARQRTYVRLTHRGNYMVVSEESDRRLTVYRFAPSVSNWLAFAPPSTTNSVDPSPVIESQFAGPVSLSDDGTVFVVGDVIQRYPHTFAIDRDFTVWNWWAPLWHEPRATVLQDLTVTISGDGSTVAVGSIPVVTNDGNDTNALISVEVQVYERVISANVVGWTQRGSTISLAEHNTDQNSTPALRINEVDPSRLKLQLSLSNNGRILAVATPYQTVNGLAQAGLVRFFTASPS